ncbi:MAG: glycoside hydrolase family 88 protein [Deltaproteobacteria bacterium]|nr:glycoside hydrolase family 88 protein [Deltaproteobacteria bacterium]MBW2534240.1 glycoside hydrolase family 88 protein [Deltaproteobacteria bacterium]
MAWSMTVATGCGGDETTEPVAPSPCTPSSPTPEGPFSTERDPSSARVELAEAIAERFMSQHPPEELTWDWGEAVLVAGLVDLYRVTADARYRDYYQAWIDYYLGVGYDHLIVASDRCPPALAAFALYQETCHEPYRQVVDRVLTYLYDEAARTEQGGISHLGTSEIFRPTLWVDSLFMFGGLLTRYGAFADDARALDEMGAQVDIFAALLQDSNGWFRHSYNWELSHDDLYWARGNGWVTASVAEYLRVRQDRGESDAQARQALESQAAAITASQDAATGLWWNILDRPGEIYLETSAAALFALGLARGYRDGLFDAAVLPVIDAAMAGVESRIETDPEGHPVVTGISGPTTVGTFEAYADVPLGDDIHYGLGAVILALLETSGLE